MEPLSDLRRYANEFSGLHSILLGHLGQSLDLILEWFRNLMQNSRIIQRLLQLNRYMPGFLFFPYYGPNRRSNKRVVELRLDFDIDTGNEIPRQLEDLWPLLIEAGVLMEGDSFPEKPLPDEPVKSYTSLLAQTAILLQQASGHRVGFFSVLDEGDNNRCTALIEYEHCDVGMTAVKLAAELINGQLHSLLIPFRQFSEFAQQRRLPTETMAIIKEASIRNIPCFQLEHEPFSGRFKFAHRVRQNGLLMLGHGAFSHILDGTFCVDQSGEYSTALLRNPDLRLALLKELGIPGLKTTDDDQRETGLFHILVINNRITTIAELPGGKKQLVRTSHPSFDQMAMAIDAKIGLAPLAIKLVTTDITRPLMETGGKILDFDLAPDLETLFDQCDDPQTLLQSAVAGILDALFPGSHSSRMPIIAITGTNGKTTTSRMASHILKQSGQKPGLVCTDGIFLDGQQISGADAGSLLGHFGVLTSRKADVAVLETHHRGIAVRGFAFEKCDVAVCLNVTEEHLKKGEIESLEEMTEIKRALLERASHAAVLNADDSNCMSMQEHLTAERTCLVSLKMSVNQLRDLISSHNACFCVLENIGDREWMVFYDRDQRTVLMRTDHIPATFDGTAAFNTINAMHAAAATHLLGMDIEDIRAALGSFYAGPEMTPGRMNEFDDLPFRVIVDFAHNPDGMRKVSEFVGRQNVNGRRLIAIPGTDTRSERANRLCAQAVSGHFDFYFCIEYDIAEIKWTEAMAPLIQRTLIESGIPENRTKVMGYGKEVLFSILDSCKPGDLLILLAGHHEIKAFPTYLREYAGRN